MSSPSSNLGRTWRRPFPLALVLALVTLVGCSGGSEESAISRAREQIARKDLAAATVELKAVLQEHPNSAAARFLLGKALLDQGNAPAAVIELEKAAELKYPDGELQPVLARALARAGQAKKVAERYEGFGHVDAKVAADVKTSLASAYWQLDDREKAERALDDALRLNPNQPDALLLRSTIRLVMGDAQGAKAAASALLAVDPKNAAALHTLGLVELQMTPNEPGRALELFRSAVAAKPDFVSGHSAIIALLLQAQDARGAKAQFQELRKVLPKHFLTGYWEAQFALLDGKIDEARQVTQALIKVAPFSVQLNALAGAIEFQGGSLRVAESHLNKVLTENPGAAPSRRLLARTYLRLDQSEKALSVIEPLLAGGKDAQALAIAGEIYIHEGDLARATEAFKLAAAVDPADARARVASALIRIGKGDAQAGYSELTAAATDDPTSYAALALFAAKMRARDKEGALQALNVLSEKAKHKAMVPFLRGRLMQASGDQAAARVAFEEAAKLDAGYLAPTLSLVRMDVAEGRFDKAGERLDGLLKQDSKNATALLAKAELEARRGAEAQKVIDLINAAVQARPSEVQPRAWQVRFLLNIGRYDAALNAAQAAATAITDNAAILLLLGDAQLAANNPRQAAVTFGRLMALQPKSVVPLLKLSDVYASQRDLPQATKMLERALQLEPANPVAQRKLIAVSLASGNRDDAMRVARAAQQRKPQLDYGFLFEGDIEASRGKWAAASKAYASALQRSQSSEAAVKLHKSQLMDGKPAEAAAFAKDWLARWPSDVRFAVYLGETALQRGDPVEAEKLFQGVIRGKPDHVGALNNLAYAMVLQGKPGALAHAEKAARLAPGDVAVLDTLSQALALDGNLQQAVVVQGRALALQPANLGLRLTLAKIHLKAGAKDDARKELDRILAEPTLATFVGREEAKTLRASL